ncbi:unnamed protein product, partial [Peniophora sp. CBMAI 1063]
SRVKLESGANAQDTTLPSGSNVSASGAVQGSCGSGSSSSSTAKIAPTVKKVSARGRRKSNRHPSRGSARVGETVAFAGQCSVDAVAHDGSMVSRDPCGTTSVAKPKTPARIPASAPPVLQDTPPTAVPDWNLSLHDAKERKRDEINEERSQQIEGLSVGPVKLQVWVKDDTITPPSTRTDPSSASHFRNLAKKLFAVISKTHGEADLCQAIIDSGLCQNLHPTDTHIIMGKDINAPHQVYAPDFALLSALLPADMDPALRAMVVLDMMEVWGDQKANNEDSHGGLSGSVRFKTRDTPTSRHSRGQFTSYSIVMFSNSFRTSVQAFLIMGDDARLFRFDRAGVIYTELFKWRQTPNLLRFLSSVDAMTPAQRGRDTSVSSIEYRSKEATRARKVLRKAMAAHDLPHGITEDAVFPDDGTHLNMFLQYRSDTRTFHRIVAHHPMEYNTSNSLTSDGARYWTAVDIDHDIVLSMKEYWRPCLPGLPSETERQARLNDAGVPHIPHVYFGSDVPNDSDKLYARYESTNRRPLSIEEHNSLTYQSTYTDQFCNAHPEVQRKASDLGGKPNERVEVIPRRLHRVFYETVFRKLETFRSAKELVEVMHDVSEAHSKAYDVGILHRCITASSIRIDSSGRGLLTNWDQSIFWRTQSTTARTKERPHSWAFLSARFLMDPSESPYLLQDDIESIIHILHYFALRFLPLCGEGDTLLIPRQKILHALRAVYGEAYVDHEGRIRGGHFKGSLLSGKLSILNWADMEGFIQPGPLWDLLVETRRLFRDIYDLDPEPPSSKGAKDPETLAKYNQDVAECTRLRDKAKENLQSSEPLLELFAEFLSDEYSNHWSTTGGEPGDQFPVNDRAPYGPRAFQRQHATSTTTGSKRPRPSDYESGTGNLKRQKQTGLLEDEDDVFGPRSGSVATSGVSKKR